MLPRVRNEERRAAGTHHGPRRDGGRDLQSASPGDEIVACCNGNSARCGRTSPRRTDSSCIAPRRTGAEVEPARSSGCCGATDIRASRWPTATPRPASRNDVAGVARVARARERARDGRRRLVHRRDAVRVRRMGRRRRGRRVAEVPDVVAWPRVRRGERTRVGGECGRRGSRATTGTSPTSSETSPGRNPRRRARRP